MTIDVGQTNRDLLQHQPFLLSEGQLREAPSVLSLMRSLDPVRSEDRCQDILLRFLANDDAYALPVIDAEGKPIALVDRKHYIEFFSKNYSREIFGRKTISDLLAYEGYRNIHPIVVEDTCCIQDVAQIIIDAGVESMVTGFAITSGGHYLGVANGHDLLNAMTQHKQAELYHLAHYDNLTGIPNRVLLGDRLEHACRDAERKGLLVALLFVDIDRFKQINDSLGHAVGDTVLRKVVERIQAVARQNDTVARLGGDEFVVLMEDIDHPADVEAVAQRLVTSMRRPIELPGQSLVVTLSIGSAIYPTDDTEISPLLAKADAAMYEAKAAGRNRFRSYAQGTTAYNPERLPLENELRQAIDNNQLVLYFQPQVELSSKAIRGVEALVRWRHPQRGLLSPIHFIAIAEESGLIVPLGDWVLREALRQARIWRAQGLAPLRISINISALQFRQRDFPAALAALLAEYDVDPRLIELELTESMLMQDVDDVVRMMEEIKALGVSLAIDDFGTGFSSLSYLRRFPIDRLKIDQSFVRGIENTPANKSIARTIIALADGLSLDIIAEGIETPAERAVLETLQCTEGQGYLFATPLSGEDLSAWIGAEEERDLLRVRDQVRQLAGLCLACDIGDSCSFGQRLREIHEAGCHVDAAAHIAGCTTCAQPAQGGCAIDNAQLKHELHEQLARCNTRRNFDMPPELLRVDLLGPSAEPASAPRWRLFSRPDPIHAAQAP